MPTYDYVCDACQHKWEMFQSIKAEAEKKVYQLTEDLLHVKKDFKDVAAGYKDRMKEIESEIKAIVEEASIGDPTK